MKTFEINFKHIDGDIRTIKIQAYNEERARLRFWVNWGNDMIILTINKIL